MTQQLSLISPDPPLLILLRELCSGNGRLASHPCPDGITEGYLAYAASTAIGMDAGAVHAELMHLYVAGKVNRTVEGDDYGGAIWRPR